MKEIIIDCFLETDSCEVISDQKQFILDNPADKQLILEVFNHRDDACQLVMTAKNLEQEKMTFLSQTDLLITSDEQLIFQDNLEEFFKQSIDFKSIAGGHSRKYVLNFDFFNLILAKEKKMALTFDLYFDFDCQASQIQATTLEANLITVAAENEITDQSSQAAVLAASDGIQDQPIINDSLAIQADAFWFSTLFYLLSGLFIVIFFVIIKFVHGKKSKKKQKKDQFLV
jgi:hypothetical protein